MYISNECNVCHQMNSAFSTDLATGRNETRSGLCGSPQGCSLDITIQTCAVEACSRCAVPRPTVNRCHNL